ncbi:MAG: ABC transporter ATP-binding protein [Bifidobacteriaceae bacterium]|jgi:ABC-type multidrug transport system ATPase subunit|nr:ABC transporter ATP-binding protein [Bifidobacteriaceae bacterium]
MLLASHAVTWAIDGQVIVPPTSLAVAEGECLAVVGNNGVGKTTLLRLLAGQLAPTGGRVECLGRPVDERDPTVRAAIASLIGVPAFYPDLTVREHLRLICATWGTPAERVGATLEQFWIARLAARFPHEMSTGQTQLFFLACAFIRPSRILILDEPEQRLDPDRKNRLTQVIAKRLAEGTAVIFAAHDRRLVATLASRVLELPDPK